MLLLCIDIFTCITLTQSVHTFLTNPIKVFQPNAYKTTPTQQIFKYGDTT